MRKLKFLSHIYSIYITIIQFIFFAFLILGSVFAKALYAEDAIENSSKNTTENTTENILSVPSKDADSSIEANTVEANMVEANSQELVSNEAIESSQNSKINEVKKHDKELEDIVDKNFFNVEGINKEEPKEEPKEEKTEEQKEEVGKEEENKEENKEESKEENKVGKNKEKDALPLENSNLNVVLLLDTSGSMNVTDPKRLRDEGVRLFLQFLKEGDKVSIVEFSEKTKVLLEPTFFNKEGLDALSLGLSKVENLGLYTDLYNAIKQAKKVLNDESKNLENKEEYQNVIVLFSDGKMEPNEKVISKEEALEKLENEVILELEKNNIKLYTLSFSDKSDRELLKSLAEKTGALSWYTPSAEKIHESFSKIFLAVQKPQILPISDKGLRIDGQIDEATFYLNVRENKNIVIISPSGRKIVKGRSEEGVRWFSGNKFEMITVEKPEAGLWNFLGSISKDDFATVGAN
ncbi:MAG: vWA domain-containing protein [Bdellovibrionota bacterium]